MIDEKLMLAFLNSAKPTQTGSPGYMSMIYSDGVDLFTTDGWRMHVAKNTFWQEGFYTDKGERCGEQSYKVLDFERVIPKNAEGLPGILKNKGVEKKLEDQRTIVQLIGCKAWFDKKFVTQAQRPMLAAKLSVEQFKVGEIVCGTLLIEDSESDTLAVITGVRHAVDSK